MKNHNCLTGRRWIKMFNLQSLTSRRWTSTLS